MKLYVWRGAPNPRRVLVYLAEKGIEVPLEDVGGEGARLKPDFVARYPQATVPMLELDDGTQIGEAMVICRWFESRNPEPPLFGADPVEQALVDMWERRIYEEGLHGAAEVFRNKHPLFVDRALPGTSAPVPQLPGLVERGRGRVARFYEKLDAELARHRYVAGERFSVADVTALVTVDFAASGKLGIPEGLENVRRWHQEVSARPSARAGL